MMQAKHESMLSLDANSVLAFLRGNPEFFNENAEILPKLHIPHETGGAISLIEKQLSVVRGKCAALENQLGELINVARENEQLHKRLHVLVQEIISASCVEDVVSLTRDTLTRNFRADDVKFLLIDDQSSKHHDENPERYLRFDDPALEHFGENFSKSQTSCSIPTDEQRAFLFDGDEKVGSIAIIPLQHERDIGMVVLSSVDPRRFDSNKDVLFLSELGQMLSRRVACFL